ncbi:hypothetical protein BDQ17DRAFT_1424854 [Cyathus striatus]|nr:hypothetical protein BDQ17DRAFT_1424854 [Cyathus striatus]
MQNNIDGLEVNASKSETHEYEDIAASEPSGMQRQSDDEQHGEDTSPSSGETVNGGRATVNTGGETAQPALGDSATFDITSNDPLPTDTAVVSVPAALTSDECTSSTVVVIEKAAYGEQLLTVQRMEQWSVQRHGPLDVKLNL